MGQTLRMIRRNATFAWASLHQLTRPIRSISRHLAGMLPTRNWHLPWWLELLERVYVLHCFRFVVWLLGWYNAVQAELCIAKNCCNLMMAKSQLFFFICGALLHST